MFRIKLLILLLLSIIQINCTSKINNDDFLIGYISGSYEGLLFKNTLEANLRGLNSYNQNSSLIIEGSISHNDEIYITNIDNTSQRERVSSNINMQIYNKELKCNVYTYVNNVSQFYIYSSGTYFLSNKKAREDIIKENTNILSVKFVNSIPGNLDTCE